MPRKRTREDPSKQRRRLFREQILALPDDLQIVDGQVEISAEFYELLLALKKDNEEWENEQKSRQSET